MTTAAAQDNLEEILAKRGLALPKTESPRIDPSAVTVARLHYGGGGDWYWGSSAIPNLLKYIKDNSNFPVNTDEKTVQIMDDDLFLYPFLFVTGHGVLKFTDEERERMRSYLNHGGFLFINDSYGMEKSVRQEIGRLFPERELVELPFDHDLYHCYYDFPSGPPKIHEHDNKSPQGRAIIVDGRVVLYYVYESDIGDGWEDPQVHEDPPEKRRQALQMGVNLLVYAMTH
jgi:hypothetical protein